jgi:hypothetical protein
MTTVKDLFQAKETPVTEVTEAVAVPAVVTEIRESDLQLVVSEKTLGSLTTNARQIHEIVKSGLDRYDIKNYNEGNIALAKSDKALLNKAAKELNAKRIEIEREFMQPFGEFKEVVNDTVKLINECSAKIDTVVRQSEERTRELKKSLIADFFKSTGFTLVPLEKIFDAKWLNKGASMKSVYADMDAAIARIQADIKTLETFGDDAGLLKSLYLDTLDISKTLQYANTLKQNREKLKAAEEAKRKAAEEAKQEAKQPVENLMTREYPVRLPDGESMPSETPFPAPGIGHPCADTPLHPTHEELLTRAFRVTTTRGNIIALGDFMNERGIDFEKIES